MVRQQIWRRNHTSHKNFYFNEFVANVLRDVIGIVIFDLHGDSYRPHAIQRPLTLALWDGPNIELKCQSVRSLYGVWPLTASMEVKNVHHISLHISNSRTKPAGLDFQYSLIKAIRKIIHVTELSSAYTSPSMQEKVSLFRYMIH